MISRPSTAATADLSDGKTRVKAEREFVASLVKPSRQLNDGFAPENRVKENIFKFKEWMKDNMEVHTGKTIHRRPNTANLQKHRHLWTEQELRSNATANGVNTGTWVGVYRDIALFSDPSNKGTAAQETKKQTKKGGAPKEAISPKIAEAIQSRKKGAMFSPGHKATSRLNDVVTKCNEHLGDRPMGFSSISSDATLMRFLLAYRSLLTACRKVPRLSIQKLFNAFLNPEGLDIAARGGMGDLRVIRRTTYDTKIKQNKIEIGYDDQNNIFAAFDIFHDGWMAHKPFLNALRCIDYPTPTLWLAYLFTVLASLNAPLHISEYHAASRLLLQDIISEGRESVSIADGRIVFAPIPITDAAHSKEGQKQWKISTKGSAGAKGKWQLRMEPAVVEFQSFRTVIFSSVETIPWKDLRGAMMDSCPALTDLLMDAKL